MTALWRILLVGMVVWLGAQAGAALGKEVLPKPPAPFRGKIDMSRDKSTPDWPQTVKAPAGAPNIMLVLLDDVGFGATSAFGGPVETPELEKLANNGLRYNQFHVNALCSPTRGALLSGRNSHKVGFGSIAEDASGYPGYNSVWSKSNASIAEVLKQNGYSTAAFGKWHNTPLWEVSPAGPFDRWPTGLGFEYFYGFQFGLTSQWEPQLYRNTVAVEPPATPDQGYHLTTDLADDAIRWLHQHDAVMPDKPFFVYFATGATHVPHHVPKEWIEKYKDKFDQGWDTLREETFAREKQLGVIPANAELTPRPAELPTWDSLSADEKRLFARQMEVYAGFLAHTDQEVGRVLQAIEDEGKADNTLVLYIVGDNGGGLGWLTGSDGLTPKGTPDDPATQLQHIDQLGSKPYTNNYAGAWGWATNTPFPWGKAVASHLGGITDPLIVSWPAKIKDKGTVRGQFHHVVDIAPTIYEVAGIKAPDVVNGVKQTPLEGASLAYSFEHPEAPSPRKLQYFETVGNRGIYKDGWFAGRRFLLPLGSSAGNWRSSIDQNPWELYNLNEDYSQTHNLADKYPAKLAELVKVFDQEARRNNVYPIAPYRLPQPSPAAGSTTFTYREGVTRLPLPTAPDLSGRSHSFTADIEISANGADGVIFAEGGRRGGFSLYLKDGKVVYELNALGRAHEKIVSSEPLPTGKARITFAFVADGNEGAKDAAPGRNGGPGVGRLSINGIPAGEAHFAWFGAFRSETFDVGCDLISPVSDDYATPFSFNGKVEKVTLELK
ncbi:Arylsulfatase [uncultured Defluviicoccus sp.]|uniref:Arylsulfatase n=1 Tax=metagenome TaxID=256318 RepID=A0A380TGM0_9ZZZZ|nr:Arylsulfatase [uncultured Defluviicoccus sp.]